MTNVTPTSVDLTHAVAVASRHGKTVHVSEPGIREIATALAILRHLKDGQPLAVAELLTAHDLVHSSPLAHRDGGCRERLAEALLARGVVPEPEDYDGKWWLWWPKKGRGPCRDCRRHRALTRFSARWGKPYRYLCANCRSAERDRDQALAAQLSTMLPAASRTAPPGEPKSGEVPSAGLAVPESASDLRPAPPSEKEWGRHVDRSHELLGSLEWAGFQLPEEWDSDWDLEVGPLLYSDIWRGDGSLVIEYRPQQRLLALQPFDDVAGDYPETYTLLDDEVRITDLPDGEAGIEAVAHAAGELGLLDPTHVRVAHTAPAEAQQYFDQRRIQRIFQPAADYRDLPLHQVLSEVTEDRWLCAFLEWVVGIAGSNVAPDIVPDAAALGVAAWCWRNDTAVEAHHLPSDVLMARVNLAVTRLAQAHICPGEGIDWKSIEGAITDPAWALPDGTTIRALFAGGWPEVASTVTTQLRRWSRIDHEMIGPHTTLILMTIGGSTSYTRHWWGQGRWRSICDHIVHDAVTAGMKLPPPYDIRGADALLNDLTAPDLLSDAVWRWLIDLPDADIKGPRGLRAHSATQPTIREWDPYWPADPQLLPREAAGRSRSCRLRSRHSCKGVF